MKGVVFTEFLTLVDTAFSPEMAEEIIAACDLPSGGVYTSVGTYSHQELIAMVVELSKRTETPVPALVKTFGHHLFNVLANSTMVEIDVKQDFFDFLFSVENYIHVEVKKLYPEASLPEISCTLNENKTLTLDYQSRCPFADLADGLLHEGAVFFKTDVEIERTAGNAEGNQATFLVKKKG